MFVPCSRNAPSTRSIDRRQLDFYIAAMSMIPPRPTLDERLAGTAGLDQRSRDIFRRLVDTYLETGEPVGSRTIARILPSSLSPASVRNVMMDLEDAGLIFSPHTSAGRVPTEQGLRFFVDAVMEVGAMSNDERARIDAQVAATNRQRRIEDLLGEATTLLSGLSHCAGVIVTPKINARLKHIEFVNLGPGPRHPRRRGWQRREPRDRGAAGPAALDLHPGLELSLDAIPGQDHRRGAALRA
jgi:hypothetical protein